MPNTSKRSRPVFPEHQRVGSRIMPEVCIDDYPTQKHEKSQQMPIVFELEVSYKIGGNSGGQQSFRYIGNLEVNND